jgi:hypothetical protein
VYDVGVLPSLKRGQQLSCAERRLDLT